MVAVDLFIIWLRPLFVLLAPLAVAWYVTRGRMRLARWLALSAGAALMLIASYPVSLVLIEEMRHLNDTLIINGEPVQVMQAASIAGVPYSDLIISRATQYNVDPAVALGLIEYESGFNPRAVSYAGAQGLGQLMPGTASDLGVRDPFDPEQNADGAMRYFRQMLDMFGNDPHKAAQAYHGGPGRISSGGAREIDIQYANTVMANAEKYRSQVRATQAAPVADVVLQPNISFTTAGDDLIIYPYDDYILTQGIHGMDYGHMAIDIKAGNGAPIHSPIKGTVTKLYTDGIGNPTLHIENGRWEVILMHGVYTVAVGDRVAIGQPVGTESNLGNTRDAMGNSCRNRDCGYHTHLNVFDKRLGANVNPLEVLQKGAPIPVPQSSPPAAENQPQENGGGFWDAILSLLQSQPREQPVRPNGIPLMIRWSNWRPEFGPAYVYAREQDLRGMLAMNVPVTKFVMVVEEQETYRLLARADELRAAGVMAFGFNPEGGHTPADQMSTLNSDDPAVNVVARVCRAVTSVGFECMYGPIRSQLDRTSNATIEMLRANGVSHIAMQEQKMIETQPANQRIRAIESIIARWPGFAYHVQIMESRCPDLGQCTALAQALPGLGVASVAIWSNGPIPVSFVEAIRGAYP